MLRGASRSSLADLAARVLLPGLTAVLAFAFAMLSSGVSARDVLVFLALLTFGYALPGAVLWQWCWGGGRGWLESVVLGSVVAHAATLLLYLAVAAAGMPSLAGGIPVVLLVLAVAARWRGGPLGDPVKTSIWLAWSMAGMVVLTSWWFAELTTLDAISGPRLPWQSTDFPYLLSLVGETKHHFPPQVPFVQGEPLHYHWFAFADVAAVSHQSGVEPQILLARLMPLLWMVSTFAAIAIWACALARRQSVATVVLATSTLAGSLTLVHAGAARYASSIADSTLLRIGWVISPSQALGNMLCVPAVWFLVELVRGARGPRPWVGFVVTSAALMGTKSTFLPVLGAGCAALVLWSLLRGRRHLGRILALGSILFLELVFAQVVLFGGSSQGVTAVAGGVMQQFLPMYALGPEAPLPSVWTVGVIVMLGWVVPLLPLSGLLVRSSADDGRGARWEPALWLVVGGLVASLGVVLVTSHPGFSQTFFIRSILPFAWALAGWGLVVLLDRTGRRPVALLVTLAVGVAVVPLSWRLSESTHLAELGSDVVLLAGVVGALGVAAVAGILWVPRRPSGTVFAAVLAGTSVCALGLAGGRSLELTLDRPPVVPGPTAVATASLPPGGVLAGRWLRDRSDPDDLVATNAHCRTAEKLPFCDARNHWVSGFSERRVLVEGWAYTARANAAGTDLYEITRAPFWDQPLLELNDAVFLDPSPENVRSLTSRHPVRWLVVDARFPADTAALREAFPRHHHVGRVWVFEVASG